MSRSVSQPRGPAANRGRARAAVLGAAVLFSTGGAAIKACALSGWQVASFRSGVAAIALAALIPGARPARRPFGWPARTWLVGVAYAATLILFVLANKSTTAANAIFLQSTAPLYLLVLAPWLLGERASRRDLVLMLAIAGGLALFFVGSPPAQITAPAPLTGNLLGGIAGITWALTLLGLRGLSREPAGSLPAVVVGNLIAFAVALPMALGPGHAPIAPLDAAVVFYLGVVQIGLAYLLLARGFREVPAFEGSLLILLEPTLSPLWAFIVHGERVETLALAGGALILAATTLKTWLDARRGGVA